MLFTSMDKFTAQFATDVTALRFGEKLEDAGAMRENAAAMRVVCGQLRPRCRCACVDCADFSRNARDDPERSFGGTERNAVGT